MIQNYRVTEEDPRAELHHKVDGLTMSQVYRVSQYVDALRRPIYEWVNPTSLLISSGWLEEFRSRLQAHHAVNTAPLTRTNFEDAFAAACEAGGSVTHVSASATNRFWDVMIDGHYYSLKTTAAKNLRHDYFHISKLTEAAWVQDQRSASGRQQKTLEMFREFRSQVESIFMLRAFKGLDGTVSKYELAEIPGGLFDSLFEVPESAFSADGPKISIPHRSNTPDLEIKIDRSDAKVTIVRIRRDRCVVHGTWDFDVRP